jgi:hypothetical protein
VGIPYEPHLGDPAPGSLDEAAKMKNQAFHLVRVLPTESELETVLQRCRELRGRLPSAEVSADEVIEPEIHRLILQSPDANEADDYLTVWLLQDLGSLRLADASRARAW